MKNLTFCLFISLAILSVAVSCSKDDNSSKEIKITIDSTTTHDAIIKFDETDGALFYDIEYGIKGQDLEYESSIDASKELIYQFKNLKAGYEYSVKITATNISGKTFAEGNTEFTTKTSFTALIGTWKYGEDPNIIKYIFNEDGFGTYVTPNKEFNIKWSVIDGNLAITKYFSDFNGSSTSETVAYNFADDGKYVTIDNTIYWLVE